MKSKNIFTTNLIIAFVLLCAFAVINAKAATQFDIIGPEGSEAFGEKIMALPNGNIVITDSGYDAPCPIANVGAVYLYNGKTGELINRITGSNANDRIGDGKINVLPSGNFVFESRNWKDTVQNLYGAATWCNGITGCSGTVSESNSLVGLTIKGYIISILTNGNFVLRIPAWNNGTSNNIGAVTWCSGINGCSGRISAANSLVGQGHIIPLPNGNYVMLNPFWVNGNITDAGAITWGNGLGGTVGEVSAANSFVGTHTNDRIGSFYDTEFFILPNSNYVALSRNWDNGFVTDAGAVTWGNGEGGTVGEISAVNSLVGTNPSDAIGTITPLPNGNYVIASPYWDNGAAIDAGAVTWGNGLGGTVGEISAANSLVGTISKDNVGSETKALTNGNYVVGSPKWSNGTIHRIGAVTWGNGNGGTVGEVSTTNSLIGSQTDDNVGLVRPLTNGNYIVLSQNWNNGSAVDAGAITWGNGFGGTVGTISAANSLVGTQSGDKVGNYGYYNDTNYALTNGNYVVTSPDWSNGTAEKVGAVTWGNGNGGTVGEISAANSLVGENAFDYVGNHGITSLSNGNYVVISPFWKSGSTPYAGAVTWGNGLGGTVGRVSRSNSLIGSHTYPHVGANGVKALPNGNYIVLSLFSLFGEIVPAPYNSGVTWGNGAGGTVGLITSDNTLLVALNSFSFSNHINILPNSNYLVRSLGWGNGNITYAGAVTWGNGLGGTAGKISAANSLIGSARDDLVGIGNMLGDPITILPNGDYILISSQWKKRGKRLGAVTFGLGSSGTVGEINTENSVFSKDIYYSSNFSVAYDSVNETMIVSSLLSNKVTIFKPTQVSNSNEKSADLNYEIDKSVQ